MYISGLGYGNVYDDRDNRDGRIGRRDGGKKGQAGDGRKGERGGATDFARKARGRAEKRRKVGYISGLETLQHQLGRGRGERVIYNPGFHLKGCKWLLEGCGNLQQKTL